MLERNPSERVRCRELLKEAILGKLDVEQLLAGREQSFLLQPVLSGFPATVYFEETAGSAYTIMEIVAPDSVGLLYRISREISDAGYNIELALISTEGAESDRRLLSDCEWKGTSRGGQSRFAGSNPKGGQWSK